jgi:hypothetical protein
MKTIQKWIVISLSLVVLLFAETGINAQNTYYTVSGTVKDRVTRRPLEYVTVSVAGHNIGTVSNADGNFLLKVPKSVNAASIEVLHVGYDSFDIPVNGEDMTGVEVLLVPFVNLLGEVIINGWDARYLVQEAIKKIKDNYSANPAQLTGFYRETVQKRSNYINISEAVIDVYKTAYTEAAAQDRVQVLKGRKLLSQRKSDTLAVKLLGGPNLSIFVDIVKNPDMLLDPEILPYFDFRMDKVTQINGRDQYMVSFQPQTVKQYLLYSGIFYIDKESLAFTRAEFHLDMDDRNRASELILRKKPVGLRFRPEKLSYIVSYQERSGKCYLSYIRNELEFKCDWRRKLFSTSYAIVSEMVVTDAREQNVTAIPRKESFRGNQALEDRVMDFYDTDFWGAYNIIEPTESLESAVARLKRQRKD